MNKIQLSLTDEEMEILTAKAALLGYNTTRYVKFIISQETVNTLEQIEAPGFLLSKTASSLASRALQEYNQRKTREIRSLSELE